jgi:hypothetical protein
VLVIDGRTAPHLRGQLNQQTGSSALGGEVMNRVTLMLASILCLALVIPAYAADIPSVSDAVEAVAPAAATARA